VASRLNARMASDRPVGSSARAGPETKHVATSSAEKPQGLLFKVFAPRGRLMIRLSDAGLRRPKTNLPYPDHRLPPWRVRPHRFRCGTTFRSTSSIREGQTRRARRRLVTCSPRIRSNRQLGLVTEQSSSSYLARQRTGFVLGPSCALG
jgi:hypothetical protein